MALATGTTDSSVLGVRVLEGYGFAGDDSHKYRVELHIDGHVRGITSSRPRDKRDKKIYWRSDAAVTTAAGEFSDYLIIVCDSTTNKRVGQLHFGPKSFLPLMQGQDIWFPLETPLGDMGTAIGRAHLKFRLNKEANQLRVTFGETEVAMLGTTSSWELTVQAVWWEGDTLHESEIMKAPPSSSRHDNVKGNVDIDLSTAVNSKWFLRVSIADTESKFILAENLVTLEHLLPIVATYKWIYLSAPDEANFPPAPSKQSKDDKLKVRMQNHLVPLKSATHAPVRRRSSASMASTLFPPEHQRDSSKFGWIRVIYRTETFSVHPMETYQRLMNVMTHRQGLSVSNYIDFAEHCVERESFIASVINVLEVRDCGVPFVTAAVAYEVEHSESVTDVLSGDSVASRFVLGYARHVSGNFLQNMVEPLLQQLMDPGMAQNLFMVDFSQSHETIFKEHAHALKPFLVNLIDHVCDCKDDAPEELQLLIDQIVSITRARYPNEVQVRCLVRNFIFTQLICQHLAKPDLFGFNTDRFTLQVHAVLPLVVEALAQIVAVQPNGSPAPVPSYLPGKVVNDTRVRLSNTVDFFASQRFVPTGLEAGMYNEINLEWELANIHRLFSERNENLGRIMPGMTKSLMKELLQIIDMQNRTRVEKKATSEDHFGMEVEFPAEYLALRGISGSVRDQSADVSRRMNRRKERRIKAMKAGQEEPTIMTLEMEDDVAQLLEGVRDLRIAVDASKRVGYPIALDQITGACEQLSHAVDNLDLVGVDGSLTGRLYYARDIMEETKNQLIFFIKSKRGMTGITGDEDRIRADLMVDKGDMLSKVGRSGKKVDADIIVTAFAIVKNAYELIVAINAIDRADYLHATQHIRRQHVPLQEAFGRDPAEVKKATAAANAAAANDREAVRRRSSSNALDPAQNVNSPVDSAADALDKESEHPHGRATFVFTSIHQSRLLAESHPRAMIECVQMHNELLRETIQAHHGYEVRVEGDSFMVVFQELTDALSWCMDTQEKLLHLDWPEDILQSTVANEMTSGDVEARNLAREIAAKAAAAQRRNDHPDALESEEELDAQPMPTPKTKKKKKKLDGETVGKQNKAAKPGSEEEKVEALKGTGTLLFRGPRVMMGIHTGEAASRLDKLSKQMEYHGSVVQVAARVCALADGGFVAVTQDVVDDIKERGSNASAPGFNLQLEEMGDFNVNGDDQPALKIHYMVAKSLEDRRLLGTRGQERLYEAVADAVISDPENDAPTGHVVLVFVDIRHVSDLLRETQNGMRMAISTYRNYIRTAVRQCGGYEVRSHNEAFMLAFPKPTQAVMFCLRTSMDLLDEKWPQDVLASRHCMLKKVGSKGKLVAQRTLPIKMGMHMCKCSIEQDEVTGRTNYFGAQQQRAARVAQLATSGQIVVSEDTYYSFKKSDTDDLLPLADFEPVFNYLGERRLPGLRSSEVVYQVLPRKLANRVFDPPPLPKPYSQLWADIRVKKNINLLLAEVGHYEVVKEEEKEKDKKGKSRVEIAREKAQQKVDIKKKINEIIPGQSRTFVDVEYFMRHSMPTKEFSKAIKTPAQLAREEEAERQRRLRLQREGVKVAPEVEKKKAAFSEVTEGMNLRVRVCGGCSSRLGESEDVVEALGKLWHRAHFKCTACAKAFNQNGFIMVDGLPYCEMDYMEKHGPRCNACKKRIFREGLEALGVPWHPECFTCCECDQMFENNRWIAKDECVFCVPCYRNKFYTRCRVCVNPLVPEEDNKADEAVADNKAAEDDAKRLDAEKQAEAKAEADAKAAEEKRKADEAAAEAERRKKPGKLKMGAWEQKAVKVDAKKDIESLKKEREKGKKKEPKVREIPAIVPFLGETWHADCFKCIECSKHLAKPGQTYVGLGSLPHCFGDGSACAKKIPDRPVVKTAPRPTPETTPEEGAAAAAAPDADANGTDKETH